MWQRIGLIAGAVVSLIALGGGMWAGFVWAVNYTVEDSIDALNAVTVAQEEKIAANSDRLALILYDRLIRKLRAQGHLSPRDLRAFCQAAARLQIRHPACR